MQGIVRIGLWSPTAGVIRPLRAVVRTHTAAAGQTFLVRQYSCSSIGNGGTPVECLRQSKDSWTLVCDDYSDGCILPRLLLVDGTNLACLCAGGRHKRRSFFSESVEERFAALLRFLQLYTQASTVLVAFDNKGSITTNVRAQLIPTYLKKRYNTAAAAAGGGDLSGWAHLGGVVQYLQQQQQQQGVEGSPHNAPQQQQQQQQQQQSNNCCYLVANAAYGFEADDVLAAAAAWASSQLHPRPLVLIASSDSDMQQLMDDHTCWLELMQVPSKRYPSGLQLHSAAEFEEAYGFAANRHADYLALVGKSDASIPGVGLSTKLAKSLIQKFGPVDSIIAAAQQGALKQCGPALEKLCSSSSSTAAESIRQKLITNKSIFKLYGQQQTQLLPQQQMQQCHAAALERQQQHLSHAAAAAAGSSAAMAAAHPAVAAHMQQITPYLNQLSRCLQQLGMVHKVGYLTPDGFWCDVVVQVYGSSSSSIEQQQQQCEPDLQATSASDWIVIQLLSPADLDNGKFATVTSSDKPQNNKSPQSQSDRQNNSQSSSADKAVDQLAHQLAEKCGCYALGNSSLGHARRKLLEYATGAAKRRVSMIKGYRVAVVPFYELHLAAAAAASKVAANPAGGATTTAAGSDGTMQYVLAVLQQQCGPTWQPLRQ